MKPDRTEFSVPAALLIVFTIAVASPLNAGGAEASEGMESNHMKTVWDDGWFVYFRLHSPLKPFLDKTFALPDFELFE